MLAPKAQVVRNAARAVNCDGSYIMCLGRSLENILKIGLVVGRSLQIQPLLDVAKMVDHLPLGRFDIAGLDAGHDGVMFVGATVWVGAGLVHRDDQ